MSSQAPSETNVPRRSVLYMPGANDKALEKAKGLATDAIIFDTEDSVAPDMKIDARAKVAAAVTSGAYGSRELTIRVNSIDTEWFTDDVRSACEAGPSGIVVPKISSVDDVAAVEALMDKFGAPAHTRIWAMLETPAAMINAVDIATSSERLAVLVMGTNDLVRELHAAFVPGRQPLLWALSKCVNAARYAGKVILDGVYNDLRDEEGFAAECRQGAELGFDGKTLVHPSQLDAANGAFAPDEDEVAQARRVIEAFEEGVAAGKGVIQLDGKMIENLHVANARRALDLADAIAARA
jgi:citrate lyase subunit beta/citryl-CoA lyase